MISLKISAELLNSKTRNLHQKWDEIKVLWKDPVSRSFDSKFIIPFFEQVKHTQHELNRLDDVITQAQRNVR